MSELTRFLFEGLPVRGALVRLDDAWQELLQRRQAQGSYPPPVSTLLGEMAAAAVLMQAQLQFNGALILQIYGDGPVKLAVAEAQPDLAFRCTAKVVGEVAPQDQLEALVNVQGQGRCAITLDPRQRQPEQPPYQGVVALYGDHKEPLQRLQQVLEHYMLQSEQLDTRLILAANQSVAAGLLIQRMPLEGAANLGRRHEDEIGLSEAYNRIALLAATLSEEELLGLPSAKILHRLFWQETLRVFEPARPRFACSCSRQRVRNMLLGLGRDESDSLIEERGQVDVCCEFCGLQYQFDAVDVGEMFTPVRDQAPGSAGMQ